MEENICRICLEEATSSISINTVLGNSDECILNIINKLSGVKIELNDGLPQEICDLCWQNLQTCKKLFDKIISSDKHLREKFLYSKPM